MTGSHMYTSGLWPPLTYHQAALFRLLQAPKPFTVARSLSSKANGIAAAPRLVIAQRPQQQQQPAALEIVAADGPRGCKLKTRKVRS